jgi:ribonuclease HI
VGLEHLVSIGARDVEAFGDSKLVVQQIRGESHCLDGMLNHYHDRCTQLISSLDMFYIEHVYSGCNGPANELAQ